MAATAWAFYTKAKKKIGNATINLGSNNFLIGLFTSASNASTASLSTYASVSNEVSNGNGYTTGGQALGSRVWTTSGTAVKFDAADPVWTATGGSIANIKFAVIKNSAGQAVCWSKLTTAQFTLTTNNTLTIQFATAGIFTLS